jgi:hypothetical protein
MRRVDFVRTLDRVAGHRISPVAGDLNNQPREPAGAGSGEPALQRRYRPA